MKQMLWEYIMRVLLERPKSWKREGVTPLEMMVIGVYRFM
jgi:hypothetical protein